MTISKERHKEIFYWLDDPYKYDQQPIDSDSVDESPYDAPTYGELRALLADSARLERVERQVRDQIKWIGGQVESLQEDGFDDMASTRQWDADELRAIVDTEHQ